MQTVELIGPPGAGKTTYVNNISKTEKMHTDRLKTFTEVLPASSLLQNIPLYRSVSRRVFSYFRPRYERDFISQFPGLLETTAAIIRNCDNRQELLNRIFREAAWFSFFSNQLIDDEIYVIDDGLYQFHLRLLPVEGWNAESVMDRLPEPDKFVFVDAPPETCLERQESRSRGRAAKLVGLTQTETMNEIEAMRSSSKEFISEARNRGIEVEIIDNA